MIKPMLIIFTLTALAGCDRPVSQMQNWDRAPLTHVCTAEQMKRVESESTYCNDNTGFLSTYCYGSAILRNCTAKPTAAEESPPGAQ